MSKKTDILERLSALLIERKNYAEDNSYTNQLYNAGNVKILEKIKEEASELIEAGSIAVSYTHLTLPTTPYV